MRPIPLISTARFAAASRLLLTAYCLLPTACSLLPAAYSAEPASEKEQIEKVQAAAKEFLTAFYKHDLETVVRLTNPKLIASWGGPIKARQIMLGPVQRVMAEGIDVIDLQFPEDPLFTHSDRNEFALVPTKLWLINRAAHRSEVVDYLFGSRPVGSSDWTFIEGSRINRANVGKYFRDFPTDVPFPPRKLKRL